MCEQVCMQVYKSIGVCVDVWYVLGVENVCIYINLYVSRSPSASTFAVCVCIY